MGGVQFFEFSALSKLNFKKCHLTSILEAILGGFGLDLADFWSQKWYQKNDQKNGQILKFLKTFEIQFELVLEVSGSSLATRNHLEMIPELIFILPRNFKK